MSRTIQYGFSAYVLDDPEVGEVRRASATHAINLDVTAGTNGPQGGDAGHGSRTVFGLQGLNEGCFELAVRLDSGERIVITNAKSLQLWAGGDAEGWVLEECLRKAARMLAQRRRHATRKAAPAARRDLSDVLDDGADLDDLADAGKAAGPILVTPRKNS